MTADDAPGSFILFESAAVRPLAWSADGSRLYVTNTPANCLEIYQVSDQGFSLQATVMVGMEPVAVALLDDQEAWVVNHLSDSISIVALEAQPHVRQTLQVGDEPRDIVFGVHPQPPLPCRHLGVPPSSPGSRRAEREGCRKSTRYRP